MINEYIYKKYKKHDPSRYGGEIKEMDFQTNFRPNMGNIGSVHAGRIISAWKFDEDCRMRIEFNNSNNFISCKENK